MASSDHLTRLLAIRDDLEKVIADELARVAALTAAGNPAPTTYTAGGRTFAWNDWYKNAMENLRKINELIVLAGADGGFGEVLMRGYT
jgi:hypothetical protein